MRNKGKITPDPYLEDVQVWPHPLIGTLELIVWGDSLGDEHDTPAWAASRFYIDGNSEKETTGFGFDGSVLLKSGITIDEIEDHLIVKVYLQPKDGEFGTICTGEEVIKEQLYEVVKFERV